LEQAVLKHDNWTENGDISAIFGFHWDDEPGKEFNIQREIKDILAEKIADVIGDYKLDFLMFQRGNQPWHIHTDWHWHEHNLPYKTIVIPIAEFDSNNEYIQPIDWANNKTYTVVFKQSHFGDTVFQEKEDVDGNEIRTKQNRINTKKTRICDYMGVKDCVDYNAINDSEYNKYFSHIERGILEGLEIDKAVEWKPNMMTIHPQSRLHCASNFHADGLHTKYSIVLFTLLND